jgi:hypothetical protein
MKRPTIRGNKREYKLAVERSLVIRASLVSVHPLGFLFISHIICV